MRILHLSAAITLAFFALGNSTKADDARTDQDKLQGAWDAIELIIDGKLAPAEESRNIKIVFTGGIMKLIRDISEPDGSGTREFAFKLDPAKQPKAIDIIRQDDSVKGATGLGIYEFQGETLKLCLPNKDTNERPKEFKSLPGSALGLFILKRAKL